MQDFHIASCVGFYRVVDTLLIKNVDMWYVVNAARSTFSLIHGFHAVNASPLTVGWSMISTVRSGALLVETSSIQTTSNQVLFKTQCANNGQTQTKLTFPFLDILKHLNSL